MNRKSAEISFSGSAKPLDQSGLNKVCTDLRVDSSKIWAVLNVETLGFGFFEDRRPQILFERHIFHRLTKGSFDASHPAISSSSPGGYSHGISEYDRLAEAISSDHDAALQSASWGIGQVMGFNFKLAGFDTVAEMVRSMISDEASQLSAVASFIRSNGLDEALRTSDWATFARKYNGPNYQKNRYDDRLKAAEAKAKVVTSDLRYRSAQAWLNFLGINPGPIDGLPGRKSRAAIGAFQMTMGMRSTGDLDDPTYSALQSRVGG